jgi:hypothetical protein
MDLSYAGKEGTEIQSGSYSALLSLTGGFDGDKCTE